MVKFRYVLICFLIGISLWACKDQNVIYNQSVKIENSNWAYTDILEFDIPVADTLSYYHLDLFVDHDPEFKYQNIYINIISTFPDGSQNEDLVSLELADKTGRWIGDCSAKNCTAPFQLKTNIRFSQAGVHKFKIEQSSRQENLAGFKQVTMKLIEASVQ